MPSPSTGWHRAAVDAATAGIEVLLVSDASIAIDRLPVPSILAAGAVHTALTQGGLRGRTDIVVDAADILDVHAMAMALAVGATAVHPRLALELATELAGSRGAEDLTPSDAIANIVDAFAAGLRKTLARMGISAIASYIGGSLIDTIDLAPDVVERCFPTAAAWPGRTTLADLGERIVRRRDAALALPDPPPGREARLPDPGFARFRADGESHLFSPRIASEIQVLSGATPPAERREPGAVHRDVARAISRGARATGSPRRRPHATSCASARSARPCRSRPWRMLARSPAGSWCRR